MVLPGIIVLIVIVVLLAIGGAVWGILTLVKKKREKKNEEEGKVARGLYVGPLQNRINQKTDIRIPLIYSSVQEPTIQFHALTFFVHLHF